MSDELEAAVKRLIAAVDLHRRRTKYTCADCGSEADVNGENVSRTCEHETSGLIAHAAAHAKGSGSLAHGVS